MDELLGLGPLEVEDEAALASVEHVVRLALARGEPADATDAVPFGGFDFDDIGTEIGQVHSAERSGDDLRNLQYLYSCQRSRHGSSPLDAAVDGAHITAVVVTAGGRPLSEPYSACFSASMWFGRADMMSMFR
jgi:hypothetical protein